MTYRLRTPTDKQAPGGRVARRASRGSQGSVCWHSGAVANDEDLEPVVAQLVAGGMDEAVARMAAAAPAKRAALRAKWEAGRPQREARAAHQRTLMETRERQQRAAEG